MAAARRARAWRWPSGCADEAEAQLAGATALARAALRRRSSAPRSRRRASAARSTWSAASSKAGADSSDGLERYDIRRNRWRGSGRCRSAVNHPTAACPGRQALRARRIRAGRLAEPTAALLRYNPRTRSLAAAARLARRRARPTPWPRAGPAVRGGRRQRSPARCAPWRSTTSAARRWRAGPQLPRPARATTRRAWPRRLLLRARRPRGPAQLHGGRALRPRAGAGSGCPDAPRARGDRLGGGQPAAGSWCSAARTSAPAGHHRRGRALRPAAAPLALPARHAHAAPRARRRGARATASTRWWAGPAPGFHFSQRDRVPRRALTCSRSRTTSRRAGSRSSPCPDHRERARSFFVFQGAYLDTRSSTGNEACRLRRDPVRDHPPRRSSAR